MRLLREGLVVYERLHYLPESPPAVSAAGIRTITLSEEC